MDSVTDQLFQGAAGDGSILENTGNAISAGSQALLDGMDGSGESIAELGGFLVDMFFGS